MSFVILYFGINIFLSVFRNSTPVCAFIKFLYCREFRASDVVCEFAVSIIVSTKIMTTKQKIEISILKNSMLQNMHIRITCTYSTDINTFLRVHRDVNLYISIESID